MLNCPECKQSDTEVIDSRPDTTKFYIRRRRKCKGCEYLFSTIELSLDEVKALLKMLDVFRQAKIAFYWLNNIPTLDVMEAKWKKDNLL